MSQETTAANGVATERLPVWVKILYGAGDWGVSSYNTLRLIFYAIFLVDVVGLDPRLASFATLFGILWDAFNDPFIGYISDRLENGRFGKRRTFLVYGAIPFGLGFMFLWWAPPFESTFLVFLTVTFAFMLADTFQSIVSVPYYSLTPEITPNYHERTSLTSFRMLFNLLSSLVVAVAAPIIVNSAVAGGATQQQGYITVSAIFGASAIVPLLLIGFFVKEQDFEGEEEEDTPSMREMLQTAWENIPFRFATGIYMLNWMTFDLIALMLPFFLTYWVAEGDLLGEANLFGINLALESAVLGVLLITAVLTLPIWNSLSKRYGKRKAYMSALAFWTIVQLTVFSIGPGQVNATLLIAFLAGIGASAAHVLPDAIFPDVMEWDELRIGQRFEGIYYGVKNFTRKLTGAFSTFIALQVLGWFGYLNPTAGATIFTQPQTALNAIRVLTGPIGAIMLILAIVVTYYYPLTREKHARIRRLLFRKQHRPPLTQ
ncbi:MAG: MFS transporter [Chloroflexota bacterium]